MTQPELVPGLAGVPAAESSVSFIDGQQGILSYRGIRIEELAEHASYEETCYLLWHGELPTQTQLDDFRARLDEVRKLPQSLIDAIRAMPRDGHPMQALQASVAMLGMTVPRVDLKDEAAREEACLRVLACTLLLLACTTLPLRWRAGPFTTEMFRWVSSGPLELHRCEAVFVPLFSSLHDDPCDP